MRAGKWRDMSVRSIDWREATVGIVGLGNIGVQVATMCSALGMKVVYTGRAAKPGVAFEYVGLEELLARSDCVVLTCLLSKDTEGMMKQNSVLVNVCKSPKAPEDGTNDSPRSSRGGTSTGRRAEVGSR